MKRQVLISVLLLGLAFMVPSAAGAKTAVYAADSEKGEAPVIAVQGDDSFLVLWHQQSGQLSVRPFSASGTPAGATRTLFANHLGTFATTWDLAALASGGYIAVWEERTHSAEVSATATRLQLLDASGQPLGTPATVMRDAPAPARVTALAGGGFVLVWGAADRELTARRWTARRFDASGAPRTPFLDLATSEASGQRFAVAVRPDGSFVVATFRPPNGERQPVTFWLLGPDGKPARPGETPAHAPDRLIRPSFLSAWPGPSGHFVITWTQGEPYPPGDRSLRARLFGPDGQPVSPEIVVAREWPDDSRNQIQDVLIQPDGSFLVLWTFRPSLLARAYSPSGTPAGADLTIETDPGFDALTASAVRTPGGWAAAWAPDFSEGREPQGPFVKLIRADRPSF